jgi:hypothetical protein
VDSTENYNEHTIDKKDIINNIQYDENINSSNNMLDNINNIQRSIEKENIINENNKNINESTDENINIVEKQSYNNIDTNPFK